MEKLFPPERHVVLTEISEFQFTSPPLPPPLIEGFIALYELEWVGEDGRGRWNRKAEEIGKRLFGGWARVDRYGGIQIRIRNYGGVGLAERARGTRI